MIITEGRARALSGLCCYLLMRNCWFESYQAPDNNILKILLTDVSLLEWLQSFQVASAIENGSS